MLILTVFQTDKVTFVLLVVQMSKGLAHETNLDGFWTFTVFLYSCIGPTLTNNITQKEEGRVSLTIRSFPNRYAGKGSGAPSCNLFLLARTLLLDFGPRSCYLSPCLRSGIQHITFNLWITLYLDLFRIRYTVN